MTTHTSTRGYSNYFGLDISVELAWDKNDGWQVTVTTPHVDGRRLHHSPCGIHEIKANNVYKRYSKLISSAPRGIPV